MSFGASYDPTTKILSALVVIAAIAAAVLSHIVWVAFLLFLAICLTYAYSARGYTVDGQSVTVKRLIGDVVIPLAGLREARAARKEDFRGCVRLWGSSGLFGYYGLFRTSVLGKCTWYVTNRKNMVVVATEAKTVLVSPDDVASFLASVGAVAPVAGPVSYAGEPARGRPIGMVVGVTIGVLALALVVAALLYSPGPPRCTLEFRSLRIHDLFYPVTVNAAEVDVAGIRVVDLVSEPDWRPRARTNGFSNSHYHSGWYRVASGEKVRVYCASGTRLVLLPPKGDGAAVLLEVRDPEEFVGEVRRLWAGM